MSKLKAGNGRSGLDRQFFYLNKRPVDLPRIAKCINEIYRMYSKKEYPIVFLHIEMKTGTINKCF